MQKQMSNVNRGMETLRSTRKCEKSEYHNMNEGRLGWAHQWSECGKERIRGPEDNESRNSPNLNSKNEKETECNIQE